MRKKGAARSDGEEGVHRGRAVCREARMVVKKRMKKTSLVMACFARERRVSLKPRQLWCIAVVSTSDLFGFCYTHAAVVHRALGFSREVVLLSSRLRKLLHIF